MTPVLSGTRALRFAMIPTRRPATLSPELSVGVLPAHMLATVYVQQLAAFFLRLPAEPAAGAPAEKWALLSPFSER